MPWLRVGDSAGTHPVVLAGAVVDGADSRSRVELFGFVALLATMSADHMTDYVVERGAVEFVGGSEAARLTRQAVQAGYLSPLEVDGRAAWRIVDDPELFHIRLREAVEWERQRKRENSRIDVTIDVVRRDGSACRYCGAVVQWADRRGGRSATYDHRRRPVRTAEDLVVACRACNSSRGAAARDGRLTEWDTETPLLPPPDKPYYCDHVAARLARHDPIAPSSVDTSTGDPGGRRAASEGSPAGVVTPAADGPRPRVATARPRRPKRRRR